MRAAPAAPANPGPGWGAAFLLRAERWCPRWVFRPALMAGTWVALACMPGRRAHSRSYLEAVFGRPARLTEQWRHFFTFMESMMLNLRAGHGALLNCELAQENGGAFETLVQSDRPALFGSFHFGCSDLLGYLLGERGPKVSILRLQVGNDHETVMLGRRFEDRVSFLWVNDPPSLIFKLKEAIEAGRSIALKCDRLEFSAKAEPFRFLGENRVFPFTIYHLSLLFGLPVIFCVAVPGAGENDLRILSSPVFTPEPGAGRAANLQAARTHFQKVLNQLETLIRDQPYLWFNFLPLNPKG